jgi:serine/threonine-protein phosphatase CPPED1
MKSKRLMAVVFFVFLVIPVSGQEQPFSFIMLTDPQFGLYAADKDFVRETANYEFAVSTVNRLKPKFVIVLGDLVNKQGNPEQIREFLRISGKIDSSIPVYYLPGNHDVGHQPTSETVAAYRKSIGRDFYSFRAGPVYGIVLDSTLFLEPKNVAAEYQEQYSWLKKELETAKASGAGQVIVFQHHPLFSDNANEPDQWGNFPVERRKALLELLHNAGVHFVFAGHLHKNICVRDGDLEITGVASVGMPFGDDGSGLMVATVTSKGLQHRYYEFGKMPDRLDLETKAPPARSPF